MRVWLCVCRCFPYLLVRINVGMIVSVVLHLGGRLFGVLRVLMFAVGVIYGCRSPVAAMTGNRWSDVGRVVFFARMSTIVRCFVVRSALVCFMAMLLDSSLVGSLAFCVGIPWGDLAPRRILDGCEYVVRSLSSRL